MGNYDLIDKRNIDRDKEKRILLDNDIDRFESVANYNFAPSPNRVINILILSSLFICDCTLIADINITNAGFI